MYRKHTPPDPNPPKFLRVVKEEEDDINIKKMVYTDKVNILKQVLEILKELEPPCWNRKEN